MSSKWNEKLVINFLKVYKQHPCLWNPYHKDYHNCREKNEALQKIIDKFDAPGFTVNDYLHQIKTIREKYKEEQIRAIKNLQSQKHYKSPFGWYNIVADMLTKVIDDEEKAKYREPISVPRSLSSDDINNSERREKTETKAKSVIIRSRNCAINNLPSRRSKSMEKSRSDGKRSLPEKTILKEKATTKEKTNKRVRYVPCPQFKAKEGGSKDQEDDMISSYKPTRDTDSVNECTTTTRSTSIDSRSNESPSLTRKNGKSYEPPFLKCPSCGWEDAKREGIERNETRNFISCCGYSKHYPGIMYTPCTGCDKVTRDDMSYRSKYPTKYVHNSGDFQVLQDLPKNVRHADLPGEPPTMTLTKPSVESIGKKNKHIDAGIQYSEDSTKIVQIDPLIANKLQYGTIEASTQLRIILPETSKSLTSDIPVTKDVSSMKSDIQEAQVSTESEKKEVGVNTTKDIGKKMEFTVCISDGARKCVSIQTLDQTNEEEKKKHCKRDTTESKEVSVNIADQISKGTQSAVCVSRGSLACCMPSEKMIEIGTSMSTHKVCSVGCVTTENVKKFQSTFVQCVLNEKHIPVTRDKSHDPVKCVRDTDLKHSVHEEVQQSESPCTTDTCPLNILTVIKEDPTVAFILQQFLRNILFKREHGAQSVNSNEKIAHEHRRYLQKPCTIDATTIAKGIKECMMNTLESSITESNAKEFYQKFDASSSLPEVEGEPSFVGVQTSSFRDSKLTMTEESIVKPKFESTTVEENEGQQIGKDNKETVQKIRIKEFPVVDKEVSTHVSFKDVGTNGSTTQLSNSDVDTSRYTERLKDSILLAKAKQRAKARVSVGTQKRDPILVRVIKCNESQGIVRSDKGTSTMGSDVCVGKNYVNKRTETCGRSTCIPPTVCRKLNENQLVDSYCVRSVCKDICDKSCKAKPSYDWTDVRNIDMLYNVPHSKIPLCMKPRKYMYAKSN
ncbi:hypothetical protein ANTQUA_LOCUS2538 [Anthophora quadrimaculata]